MTLASEYELALSMMRLWGKNAKYLARNYALDYWCKGDETAYNRWNCVERIVEQAQAAPNRKTRGAVTLRLSKLPRSTMWHIDQAIWVE